MNLLEQGMVLLSGRKVVPTATYTKENHQLPTKPGIGWVIEKVVVSIPVLDANGEYFQFQISDKEESALNPIDVIIYDGRYCFMAGAAYYWQHQYTIEKQNLPDIIISKLVHIGFYQNTGVDQSGDYRIYLRPVSLSRRKWLLKEEVGA